MSGIVADNSARASGVVAAASAGRTGTVDWVTTPKVTGDSPVTAVSGEGYFLNTTAGVISINLPAGAAGSIVSVADYARTWNTYNVTVVAAGSDKIGGVSGNTPGCELDVDGQSATFVFVDATQGWVNIQETETSKFGTYEFINATVSGACNAITTCGDYKMATFKGPGTFDVVCAAQCAVNNAVDYFVVAGGGSGQWSYGGGGGGGFRFFATTPIIPQTGTGAPRNGYGTPSPSGTAITVSEQAYSIVVGAGGAGAATGPEGNCNTAGGVSTFSTVTSAGGGKGGNYTKPGASQAGVPGGSGGGGGSFPGSPAGANPGGTGNDPSTTPPQGSTGGSGWPADVGGGGGGAMAVGGNAAPPYRGGSGGAGAGLTGFGTNGQLCGGQYYFSGGGGGGNQSGPVGPSCYGAAGIGGAGDGDNPAIPSVTGVGTANSGGGGGGGWTCASLQTGGSGVVVIRYKFQ